MEIKEIYTKYPKRESKVVTRLGPSPTGFIHLGNLWTALINFELARQDGGVFYLRIEDTDKKREQEGASEMLIEALHYYGIDFNEGVNGGNYAPYKQSERKEIYDAFINKLLDEGKAYYCFLTEEEIEKIREEQTQKKLTPGIHSSFSKYRNLEKDEAKKMIESGTPYVIRIKSQGVDPAVHEDHKKIVVDDGIRGELEMPANFLDVVIQKRDGLPTYHFAHVIDDYLMGTTHVIRGEEWLSSLPIHIELFNILGFAIPIYAHMPVLMKMEGEKKRKLSKRLDPELSLDYYKKLGFHKDAIREYLYTITNSNFELWRKDNDDKDIHEFNITLDKIGKSGALFDLDKLIDISKNVLLKKTPQELYDFFMNWANEFDKDFYDLVESEGKEYFEKLISVGRTGEKPRKDIYSASMIREYISFYFDKTFEQKDDLPEIKKEEIKEILEKYLDSKDFNDDKENWFNKVKAITEGLGFAVKPKDYKKNPENYGGSIVEVTNVIRIAITGLKNSPDIFEIENVLGEQRTKSRIKKMMSDFI